jgi:SET domain-containing protein
VQRADDAEVAPTRAGASRIAGRGLFAAHPIPAGRPVLRLDGTDVREHVNHSCEPNLGWLDDETLVTITDVSDGDELLVDYATGIDDAEFVMMCHCETYRCRQVIEGTDWQIPQLQQRYAVTWAPAVQRKIHSAAR